MSEALEALQGSNGTLNVYADHAEIVGLVSAGVLGALAGHGSKNTRTYFYRDLNSVEYQPPTTFKAGYVRFIVGGSMRGASGSKFFGGVSHASDMDTVTLQAGFMKKDFLDQAEKVYKLLMSKISDAKQSGGATVVQTSDADELAKFKKLLDDGIISQDEFNAKKKQLLGI